MAKTFRHNVIDGWIFVNNNATESMYPYSWWLTQEPAYTYPSGASYVQYTEGGVSGQSYYIKNNSQTALPIDPWPAANAYIAKQANYDADYAAYIGTPKTIGEAKAIKFNELFGQYEIIISGGIQYIGSIFPSGISPYQSRTSELGYSTVLTFTPGGYYVKDINGVHVLLSLLELTALVAGIEELHYLCRIAYDMNYEAIDALSDISSIMAYDVTSYWPAVPFNVHLTFNAGYSSGIDADFSIGLPTGASVGGAAVSGGYLDLTYNDTRYVTYDPIGNADSQQVGTISLYLNTNYTGTPASEQSIFVISKADTDPSNRIQLVHDATGVIRFDIADSTGTGICSVGSVPWNPIMGTDYHIIMHYDITSGNNYMTIDGVVVGAVDVSTGVRDNSIGLFGVGAAWDSFLGLTNNFRIKSFSIENN